jgi:hypothetical protein
MWEDKWNNQNGIVLLFMDMKDKVQSTRQEEWSAIYNFVQDKICL